MQVCEICKYEPPLTRVLKHLASVFNYLSQVLRNCTYSGIYIKKSLLINLLLRVKKMSQRCSVIPYSHSI